MTDCELTADTANYHFHEDAGMLEWTGDDEHKNMCMQINPRPGPEV